ncbi:MAG: hypothetical protein HRT71_12435 [Flavobacteriales bacterium]|nr:hypothetical protein [Flavobacteriales bacterium]
MIKLRNIISQLNVEDFEAFGDQLLDNKADKYNRLLVFYREDYLTDDEVSKELNVSSNAYYTIKSRLFQKVQNFLLEKLDGPKVDLLRKVANIPSLMFGLQKSTAVAILLKLEKELLEFDMPNELATVYNALKKINLHSSKYYHYTQLYNKHIAYTIAFDKVESLLSDFHKHLGDYIATKDPEILDVLVIIKREAFNSCRLYDSHHLRVFNNMIDISFGLFVPREEEKEEDKPIENMLTEIRETIKTYPRDTTYQYLKIAYYFLAYEYYHNLGLFKKENEFFKKINENLTSFLLYNFVCYTSKFLISKLERYVRENNESELVNENYEIVDNYEPDISDIPNYINYTIYMSVSSYYDKDYNEAILYLNQLVNDISLKSYIHAEIEIKLLLSTCYLMFGKKEQANYILRTLARKIREGKNRIDYENATTFAKLLKLIIKKGSKTDTAQLEKLSNRFTMLNQGASKMLSYIKIDGIIAHATDRTHNAAPENKVELVKQKDFTRL